MEDSADRVLANLRLIRGGVSRSNHERSRKRIADEMSRLFRQKKPRDSQNLLQPDRRRSLTWTHHFVCLAQVNRQTIPTTAREKDALFSAGLGEKKIVFSTVDCNAEEFREILFTTFPKLREGGGYQLCKCRPNSRELEPLSSAAMTSPKNLRDFGGKSRTYIRPLQRELDLSRTNLGDDVDVVSVCVLVYTIYMYRYNMHNLCIITHFILRIDYYSLCNNEWVYYVMKRCHYAIKITGDGDMPDMWHDHASG